MMQALTAPFYWFQGSSSYINDDFDQTQRERYIHIFTEQLNSPQSSHYQAADLQWIKGELIRLNVTSEHDLIKKIDQRLDVIQQIANASLRRIDSLELLSSSADFNTPAPRHAMNALRPVGQNQQAFSMNKTGSSISFQGLTLNEATALIIEKGDTLTELDVRDLDDELCELIAEKCPSLTSFTFNSRLSGTGQNLTNVGVQHLSTLTKLTKIEIKCWLLFQADYQAWVDFFSQPHFKENVTDLSIEFYHFSNTTLATLADYKKLKNLAIFYAPVNHKGLTILTQSPSLNQSLETLNLQLRTDSGTIYNSEILANISHFKNLQKLNLMGEWDVKAADFQFLAGNKHLVTLGIQGVTLPVEAVSLIAEIASLQELIVTDCSSIPSDGFKTLFSALVNLQSLKLYKAGGLYDASMAMIGRLPKLTSLALADCGVVSADFIALMNQPILQNNLESLKLINFAHVSPQGFNALGKLNKLQSLILSRCNHFNDVSFETLATSPMRDTLVTLGLDAVAVSDAQVLNFASFNALRNLLLSSCNAITTKGYTQLLSIEKLQINLGKLFSNNMSITDDMVKLFASFTNLYQLWESNSFLNELSYNGELKFFEVQPERKEELQISLSTGETNFLSEFESH